MIKEEIWKDIKGYEGLYKISNKGNVMSTKFKKHRLLSFGTTKGYSRVNLYKDMKRQNVQVHVLVAVAFLGHEECGHKIVVDHINEKREDNRVDNLRLVTNRFNCSRGMKRGSSKFVGVSFDNARSKWVAKIFVSGKNVYLGRFEKEVEAFNAYENKRLSLCL